MIQYILWGISFISLWITLVWLNFLLLEPENKTNPKKLPRVTIALPCYNREEGLSKTITSLAQLHYPSNLLQIIIVDDCSQDNTFAEAKRLQAKHQEIDIMVIQHTKNQGKAAAMNTALTHATGELFACLDADTRVHPDALNYLVPHFSGRRVGAVIGQVKVDNPRNLYESLQRVEYILSNFLRRILSNMSTLFIAPGGACSLFKTGILKKIGWFAEGGLTEDLEIAMRLKAHGYDVKMEHNAITHTTVPQNWSKLWSQRIRWYRGFVVNHLKYRNLFFKRSHGLFGVFQLPINIVGVLLMLVTISLVSYGGIHDLYEFMRRSLTINGYFWNHVLDFPTLKELLLAQNIQITLPLLIGTLIGIYIIYLAHRQMKEKLLKNLHYVWLYFILVPYVTTVHWISALASEAMRTRRKW